MQHYVVSRLGQSLVSLVGLVILVFFMIRLTGNPADLYLPDDVSAEARQRFIDLHDLDAPLHVQFANFVRDLLSLDLGTSIRQSRPAIEIVLEAYPVSLALAGISMGIALGLAILLGVWAAVRPTGAVDRTISVLVARRRQRAELLGGADADLGLRGLAAPRADLGHRRLGALGAARRGPRAAAAWAS